GGHAGAAGAGPAGGRTGGILLILLFSVAMVYLSGGFVPFIFLPEAMCAVGEKLPTAYMIRACGGLFAGYGAGEFRKCAVVLCSYAAACGAAAYAVRKRSMS
ncbi:MAG: hypothetical protein NC311_19210, partial [Muribaculaceae bacterium]|nr:hypothetical protein [Muribaculaceae bacterium]